MKRDFPPSPATTKSELRRAMRAFLRALDPGFRAEASLAICEATANLPAFRAASCVAFFAPLASEPDIHPLIEEAWAQGKRVVLPRMLKSEGAPLLEWHALAKWDDVVESGALRLREPDPVKCPVVAAAELDFLLVPGLAFDRQGRRLGRGGGFYDCFLAAAPAHLPRVGLMFAGQGVPALPAEPHDQALSAVITEDGVLSFSAASGG